MEQERLIGAPVQISAPDGRIFLFHVAAVEVYAGTAYAVLENDEDSTFFLVARMERQGEGHTAFYVSAEEDVIDAVLGKYLDRRVKKILDANGSPDETEPE